MDIRLARRGINRFGARKYAYVESTSTPGIIYTVAKLRKRGTRNYFYRCTCPDNVFRNRLCKHIKAFKEKEKEFRYA